MPETGSNDKQPPESPRGDRWWHHVHFRHPSMRYALIKLGHWSSLGFIGLIALTPFLPNWLYAYHDWIGYIYLAIQFAEINAEDHLHNKEVLVDHLLSMFPAIVGTVMLSVILFADKVIDPLGWHALKWFTAIAWFDFIGGVVINNTILNAPYQREEQQKD